MFVLTEFKLGLGSADWVKVPSLVWFLPGFDSVGSGLITEQVRSRNDSVKQTELEPFNEKSESVGEQDECNGTLKHFGETSLSKIT